MQFRFLKTGYRSAAENMAIDEALLNEIAEERSLPVLRLYAWKPPAISIGYFQSLEEEIDLNACQTYGVEYVRRITGGGAVLHEHEVTYSFLVPLELNVVHTGILESYEQISQGIIEGLKMFDLQAQFIPLNDIIVNGKKISGNAQTRKHGVLLQHGTVLLDVDVEKMFELLKVPSEKLKGKLIEDVKQRVTSLSHQLERKVVFEEGMEILEKGFKKAFPDISFEEETLRDHEKKTVQKIAREKYKSEEWNRKRVVCITPLFRVFE